MIGESSNKQLGVFGVFLDLESHIKPKKQAEDLARYRTEQPAASREQLNGRLSVSLYKAAL